LETVNVVKDLLLGNQELRKQCGELAQKISESEAEKRLILVFTTH